MNIYSLQTLFNKCLNIKGVLCLLLFFGLQFDSFAQVTTIVQRNVDTIEVRIPIGANKGVVTGKQLHNIFNPSGLLFYDNRQVDSSNLASLKLFNDTTLIRNTDQRIFVVSCDKDTSAFVGSTNTKINGFEFYGVDTGIDTIVDLEPMRFMIYDDDPQANVPPVNTELLKLVNGSNTRYMGTPPLSGSGAGVGIGNSARDAPVFFKIIETTPPNVVCKPLGPNGYVEVSLDSLGLITAMQLDGGSTDNCTPDSLLKFSISTDTIRCDSVGKNAFDVWLVVEDVQGNRDSCMRSVKVVDKRGPDFIGIPKDTTIDCNQPIPAQAAVSIRDNCTPFASLTNTNTAFIHNIDVDSVMNYRDTITSTRPDTLSEYYNYRVVYFYTAEDAHNQVSVDSQVIYVQDTLAPQFVIGTQDTLLANSLAGATDCSATVSLDLDQIVKDNCADSTIIYGFKTGPNPVGSGGFITSFPRDTVLNLQVMMGDTAFHMDVQDFSGNRDTIQLLIRVDDKSDPNPVCSNVSLTINSLGFVVVTPLIIGSNSTDNCGTIDSMWVVGRDTFRCADVGQTFNVDLMTRDQAGNTAGCQAAVTIQDFTGSNVFSCPRDTTVDCGHNLDPTLLGLPSVIDVCGTDDTTFFRQDTTFGGTAPVCLVVNRTWVSRDINGNETVCLQKISLIDSILPVLDTTFMDATVVCIADASTADSIMVTDNCAETYMSPAIDSIRCAADTIYFQRIWQASDGCNIVADTQLIKIFDEVDPTITFPASRDTFTYFTSSGNLDSCGVFVNRDLQPYADDCNKRFGLTVRYGTQDTTSVLTGYFTTGYHTVNVTAEDTCGNKAAKNVVIEVIDNTRPTLVCVTNLNISLGTGGTGILTVADVLSSVTDNCGGGIDTTFLSQTVFDCSDLGFNQVFLTAIDTSGNQSTCMVEVEVTNQGNTSIISIATDSEDETGVGEMDGMAWVEVTGGSGNYTYAWAPGNATTDTIRNLAPGLYMVTVNDATNGCRLTDSIRVNAAETVGYALGSNATGMQGEIIQIPVIVSNFDSVAGFEMKFTLNSTSVATFVNGNEATGFNFPGLANTAFQYQSAGVLDVTSLPSTGTTLADGTTLFLVNVRLTGLIGQSTTLSVVPLQGSAIESSVILNGMATPIGSTGNSITVTIVDVDPTVSFGGNVNLVNGNPLSGIEVTLSGDSTATNNTDASGAYSFEVEAGQNLTVRPAEDRNHSKGLTVTDLALIQRHILGTKLDSPYKILAADVNNSQTITVTDLAQIQAVILGTLTEFITVPSWKFIPADVVLDINDPWANAPLPDSIGVVSDDADFIGYKMGDANLSAATVSLRSGDEFGQPRSTFRFGVEDRLLKEGEVIDVPFKAKNFVDMYAYQMTLNADAEWLSFEGATSGALTAISESNFGLTKADDGLISTLWYSADPLSIEQNATLFTISFRVNKGGKQLSDILRASSDMLHAQAHATNKDAQNISLTFDHNPTLAGFELFQNKPNPFSTETTISFTLPKGAAATLRFYDFSGRMVHRVKGNYESGINNVIIHKNDLASSGVLYYELETPEFTARKKMIILD